MQGQDNSGQHSCAYRHGPNQPAPPRRALSSPKTGQDAHLEPRAWLFAAILLQRGLEQFVTN